MPPPSQLAIATSAVNRLVKEEASYHKELEQQKARIAKLENDKEDENAEWNLKQEKRGVEETMVMFPQLKKRIQDALARLEQQLEQEQSNPEEITKAKEAVASASAVVRETS